jgi:hypothetical protein
MLNARMPAVTLEQYQNTFERGRTGDDIAIAGRTVLLLGDAARDAFGLKRSIVHPTKKDGTTFRWIHCPTDTWYSDELNCIIVGMLLEDLYVNHG